MRSGQGNTAMAALGCHTPVCQLLIAVPQLQCDHDFGKRLRYTGFSCSIRKPALAIRTGMSRVKNSPSKTR